MQDEDKVLAAFAAAAAFAQTQPAYAAYAPILLAVGAFLKAIWPSPAAPKAAGP